MEEPFTATSFLFLAELLEVKENRLSEHEKAVAFTEEESCTLFSVPSLAVNVRFRYIGERHSGKGSSGLVRDKREEEEEELASVWKQRDGGAEGRVS